MGRQDTRRESLKFVRRDRDLPCDSHLCSLFSLLRRKEGATPKRWIHCSSSCPGSPADRAGGRWNFRYHRPPMPPLVFTYLVPTLKQWRCHPHCPQVWSISGFCCKNNGVFWGDRGRTSLHPWVRVRFLRSNSRVVFTGTLHLLPRSDHSQDQEEILMLLCCC